MVAFGETPSEGDADVLIQFWRHTYTLGETACEDQQPPERPGVWVPLSCCVYFSISPGAEATAFPLKLVTPRRTRTASEHVVAISSHLDFG